MSGPPSDATIWTRERRYFFTSRSHRMKTTVMRSSPPHAGDLPHLVCGCGALVPDRRTGEREERRFERIGAGLLLQPADEPVATMRPWSITAVRSATRSASSL